MPTSSDSVSAFTNLQQVATTLRTCVPDAAKFDFLCTRLMLRTGVDLNRIRPEQAADPAQVGQILAALRDLGFPMTGGDNKLR